LAQAEFDLYIITDRHQCKDDDLEACIERAMRGGVRAVQLREKDLSTRERYEVGMRLRQLTSKFGARLLVNGDVALARAVRADGVHLPQDGLPADICRKLLEPGMLLGVSAHTVAEAREAEDGGADFITYGPVYHTPSKAKYGAPVGLDSLRAVCAEVRIPVLALGGIKASNVEEVLSAGAAGVAMISAVLAEPDVEAAASEILKRMRESRSARAFPKKEGRFE